MTALYIVTCISEAQGPCQKLVNIDDVIQHAVSQACNMPQLVFLDATVSYGEWNSVHVHPNYLVVFHVLGVG